MNPVTAYCHTCKRLQSIKTLTYLNADPDSVTAVHARATFSCGHRSEIVTSYRTYLSIERAA